jgi:hypothetical protein
MFDLLIHQPLHRFVMPPEKTGSGKFVSEPSCKIERLIDVEMAMRICLLRQATHSTTMN